MNHATQHNATAHVAPVRPVPAYYTERATMAQVKQLTTLISELTLALVVQGSYLTAVRNHRARPNAGDVDEAIERVADNVPLAVAEELWAGRDALVARLLDDEPSA